MNNPSQQVGVFNVGFAPHRIAGKTKGGFDKHEVLLPEGWAEFNKCPHLLVEIPKGISTISVQTSEGKRITFSFLPYGENGHAQCVDIQHHGEVTHKGGNGDAVPSQEVRVFGLNKKDVVIRRREGYGLVSVIMKEDE